ncbi:hypothetical protein BJ741DRAFT_593814 [Chytriomyces cf. hyalinus JEL632]|nr:hypothetical protein BJ741DRAFT_593814 [Chytriomyces cf. hyalinus JEL632]
MQTFGHVLRAQSAPPVLSHHLFTHCEGKDAEFADSGCCLLESDTSTGHAPDKQTYSATCSEAGSDLLPYSRIQNYADRLDSVHDAVLDPSAWNTRVSPSPISESAESSISFHVNKRIHDVSNLSEADYCDVVFGHSTGPLRHHMDATNSPCSSIASSFRSQRNHQSSINDTSYESKQSHFSSLTSRQFPKHEFQASSSAADPFDEDSGVEYSLCQDEDDAANAFREKSPARVLRKRRCRSFDSTSISSYQNQAVWSSNQECVHSFESKSQATTHGSPSIFSSPIHSMNEPHCRERVQFLHNADDTQLPFEINNNTSQREMYPDSVNRSPDRSFSPETHASKPKHQRQGLDLTRLMTMEHAISLLESENVQLMNLYLETQRRLQFSEAENHGLRTRFKRRCNDCCGGTDAEAMPGGCYRSENAVDLDDADEKQPTEILGKYQVEEVLDASNHELESKSVIESDDSDFEAERASCAITTTDSNERFIQDNATSQKIDEIKGVEVQTPSFFGEDDMDELPSDMPCNDVIPVETHCNEPLNSQHMQPHELKFLKTEASETTLALAQSVATIRSGLEKGFSQVVEGMAALRRVEEKLEALGSLFGKDL